MPVIIDGTLGVNAAAVTTTSWNPTNLVTPGNSTLGDSTSDAVTVNSGTLNFAQVGQRITGDFTNSTIANRLIFQTNVTNGSTGINVIPNGTSAVSGIAVANNSDATNYAYGQLAVTSTSVNIDSSKTGTGTNLPLLFRIGGAESLRLDTSGNANIGGWNSLNGLRYLDVQNSDSNSASGSIIRLITLNSGGTGNTSVDMVKYKSGGFVLNNNDTSGYIAINNAGSERIRIASDGMVGIGVAPTIAKLQVKADDGSNTNEFRGLSVSGSNSAKVISLSYDNTNDYGVLSSVHVGTTWKPIVIAPSGGNVGVGGIVGNTFKLAVAGGSLGTNAGDQQRLLTMYAHTGNSDYLEFTNTRATAGSTWPGAGFRIQQKVDSTWMAYIQFNGNNNGGGISFGAGGNNTGPNSVAEALRITGDGYVGIGLPGVSTQYNILQVAGTPNATSASSRGIALNYSGTSTSVTNMIGFSWSGSIGNYQTYWGMGFTPTNYSSGIGRIGLYVGGNEKLSLDSNIINTLGNQLYATGNVVIGSKKKIYTLGPGVYRFTRNSIAMNFDFEFKLGGVNYSRGTEQRRALRTIMMWRYATSWDLSTYQSYNAFAGSTSVFNGNAVGLCFKNFNDTYFDVEVHNTNSDDTYAMYCVVEVFDLNGGFDAVTITKTVTSPSGWYATNPY